MAQVVKKVIISNSDLPPVMVEKEGYVVKYRVISEDKNRVSHWSNPVLVKPEYTFVPGSIAMNKASSIVSIIWDTVKINKGTSFIKNASEYDVWLKWGKGGNGDWIYQESVLGTTLSALIPSTYNIGGVDQEEAPNQLSIEVYLRGTPVTRDFTLLKVYSLGPETV